jgi:hypothetical protein
LDLGPGGLFAGDQVCGEFDRHRGILRGRGRALVRLVWQVAGGRFWAFRYGWTYGLQASHLRAETHTGVRCVTVRLGFHPHSFRS